MIRIFYMLSVVCGVMGASTPIFASNDPTEIDLIKPIVQHFYPDTNTDWLLNGLDLEGVKDVVKAAIRVAAQDDDTFLQKILFEEETSGIYRISYNLPDISEIRTIVLDLDFEKLSFTVKQLTFRDCNKVSHRFPALLFKYNGEDESTRCIDHQKKKIDPNTGKPEQVSIEEYKMLTKLPAYMPTFNMERAKLVQVMNLRRSYPRFDDGRGYTLELNCRTLSYASIALLGIMSYYAYSYSQMFAFNHTEL